MRKALFCHRVHVHLPERLRNRQRERERESGTSQPGGDGHIAIPSPFFSRDFRHAYRCAKCDFQAAGSRTQTAWSAM